MLALNMYTSEYDGWLLSGYADKNWDKPWWVILGRYASSNQNLPNRSPSNPEFQQLYKLFICPSAPPPISNYEYTHYGVNTNLMHRMLPVRKLTTVIQPTKSIVYTDNDIKNSYVVNDDRGAAFRHSGDRTLSSYLDGHVESRKEEVVGYWKPYNNTAWFINACPVYSGGNCICK